MKFYIFVSEGRHVILVGDHKGYDTLEDAKAAALCRVDDALPNNTIHVMQDLGHAFLAGDGGNEWEDRK